MVTVSSPTRESRSTNVEWVNPLEAWEGCPAWSAIPNYEVYTKEYVPPCPLRFRAFELVKPKDVKVVILGQDPYPTRGHANGLAFSVNAHVKRLPKSLENIYREYSSDLSYPTPRNGDLSSWARNGVLLLNTALTTEEGKRGAHVEQWRPFTTQLIKWLSRLPGRRVFILWGAKAQEYGELIGKSNVRIESAHPSPLSARGGFFGSRPFSNAARELGVSNEFWRLS